MTRARNHGSSRRLPRGRVCGALAAAAGLVGLLAVACSVSGSGAPGTLEVRVAADEVPLPGATVGLLGRLAWIGERYPVAPAGSDGRTDGRGVVVFEGLNPSDEFEVHVSHPDFVPRSERAVLVEGGGRRILDVALRPGLRVRGRLVGPAGDPLPDVAVRVLVEGPGTNGATTARDLHLAATTAADGSFLTEAVEPGAPLLLRVHLFRNGAVLVGSRRLGPAGAGTVDAGELRVLATETVFRLDGEAPRPGLRVRGVLDAAGSGTASEFGNASFGDEGRCLVVGLPEGVVQWTLYEALLGPPPNERIVGRGRAELTGPRREVTVRRTPDGR